MWWLLHYRGRIWAVQKQKHRIIRIRIIITINEANHSFCTFTVGQVDTVVIYMACVLALLTLQVGDFVDPSSFYCAFQTRAVSMQLCIGQFLGACMHQIACHGITIEILGMVCKLGFKGLVCIWPPWGVNTDCSVGQNLHLIPKIVLIFFALLLATVNITNHWIECLTFGMQPWGAPWGHDNAAGQWEPF